MTVPDWLKQLADECPVEDYNQFMQSLDRDWWERLRSEAQWEGIAAAENQTNICPYSKDDPLADEWREAKKRRFQQITNERGELIHRREWPEAQSLIVPPVED